MALGRRKNEEIKEKILDVDASMQGTLTFKDPVNLRINGKFEGKLQTKGNLTISEHAIVGADINAENIIVAGKVNGNIKANVLKIIAPGCIVGDVKTSVLSITEGAVLEGYCNMLRDEEITRSAVEMLTIDEVAKYLEVDKNVVTEWADIGKLPAVKQGAKWRFDKSKIEDWLTSERIK